MTARTTGAETVPVDGCTPGPSRRPCWTFLPAYAKDGTVKAWAFLDSEDHEWAKEKRWYLSSAGYFCRNLLLVEGDGVIPLHREILGLEKGDPREADHINRDKLDNRRCNLRITDSRGNKQNSGMRSDNTSGFRGVYYHKNKNRKNRWQARCCVDGHDRSLGYYRTAEEAGEVARLARARYMTHATD